MKDLDRLDRVFVKEEQVLNTIQRDLLDLDTMTLSFYR